MRNSIFFARSLLMAGSVIASAAWLCGAGASPALADDCLLDTNNDGAATPAYNTDTDLGADSGGDDSRLACGKLASFAN